MPMPSKWSAEEVEILKKYYTWAPRDTILKLLPRKTWKQIRKKAELLGLKRSRIPQENREKILKYMREGINISDTEAAYIAGIIDGEGSIYILRASGANKKKYPYPRVVIYNTSEELIDWIKKVLDKAEIRYTVITNPREGKYKTCYAITIDGIANIYPLLKSIEPYIVIKRDRVRTALEEIRKLIGVE